MSDVDRVGCAASVYSGWGFRAHCGNRAVEGKGYCRTHDPVTIKKRRDDQDAKYERERRAEEAIIAESKRLLRRLKVEGAPEYHWKRGYVRGVVIRFEEVEKLIKRLEGPVEG